MNSSYPHHLFHLHELSGHALPPICVYCLHVLGGLPPNASLNASERRAIEEHHVCMEKMSARQPATPLPFN